MRAYFISVQLPLIDVIKPLLSTEQHYDLDLKHSSSSLLVKGLSIVKLRKVITLQLNEESRESTIISLNNKLFGIDI